MKPKDKKTRVLMNIVRIWRYELRGSLYLLKVRYATVRCMISSRKEAWPVFICAGRGLGQSGHRRLSTREGVKCVVKQTPEPHGTSRYQIVHGPLTPKQKGSFSSTRQMACVVALSNVRAKCGQIRILAENICKQSRYDTGKIVRRHCSMFFPR